MNKPETEKSKCIRLPEPLHKALKIRAAKKGVKLKELVYEILGQWNAEEMWEEA